MEMISFIVPRKMEGMDHELYPDMLSVKPSMSSDEWKGGENKLPNRIEVSEEG